MTIAFRPALMFRTSSECTGGAGVEVSPLPDGGAAVRDTKDRAREPLTFDRQEWVDFVLGVKNGEFDFQDYSPFRNVDPDPRPPRGR